MKLVSINRAETTGKTQIAFNVDEQVSPDLLERIEYGNLIITGEDTVLKVSLPEDRDEDFSEESVKTLNRKLAEAMNDIAAEKEKHERLLAAIARDVGLPLD